MAEFFDFILWFIESFVNFILALPFMPDFTFGQVLIALGLMAVLLTALISSIRVANLSAEARNLNATDRINDLKGG